MSKEDGVSESFSTNSVKILVDNGVVVLGKRGAGKTTLVKTMVKSLPYDMTILDVVGNLKDLQRSDRDEYYLVNPHDKERVDSIIQRTIGQSNRMVVLDEADRYDYGMTKKTPLSDLVNIGRNYGVGYIASARRTANIPKDFLSNQDWAFIFKHTFPTDIEVLEAWFGLDGSVFRNLEPFEFIVFKQDDPLFQAKIANKENTKLPKTKESK